MKRILAIVVLLFIFATLVRFPIGFFSWNRISQILLIESQSYIFNRNLHFWFLHSFSYSRIWISFSPLIKHYILFILISLVEIIYKCFFTESLFVNIAVFYFISFLYFYWFYFTILQEDLFFHMRKKREIPLSEYLPIHRSPHIYSMWELSCTKSLFNDSLFGSSSKTLQLVFSVLNGS